MSLRARIILVITMAAVVLVMIGLTNPDAGRLTGTLRAELVGPGGVSLGKAEQAVRQDERANAYRFTRTTNTAAK